MIGAGAGVTMGAADVPRPPVAVAVTFPVVGVAGTVAEKGALFLNAELALVCAFKFICCAGEIFAAVDPSGALKFIRKDCWDDVSPPTKPGVAAVLLVVTPGPVRLVLPGSPGESPPTIVDDGAPLPGLAPGTPVVPGVPTDPVPIRPMDAPGLPPVAPAPTAWGKAGEIPITKIPQKAADSAHLREVSMMVLPSASDFGPAKVMNADCMHVHVRSKKLNSIGNGWPRLPLRDFRLPSEVAASN